MVNPAEQPWAEFADSFAQELLEHRVTEAVYVTREAPEDRVVTHFYNCDFEKKCALVGHLLSDLILEVICQNAGMINDILNEEDEDGGIS